MATNQNRFEVNEASQLVVATKEGSPQVAPKQDVAGRRVLLSDAKALADAAVRHLQSATGVLRIDIAGSIRRRKETVGDLDLLVMCKHAGPVMDRLADYEAVAEVLERSPTKMSVRLQSGMQLDLTVVPKGSHGTMLQAYTGSKTHTAELRRRADEQGLRVTDFGVFRGRRRIAGSTEEEVYQTIGLPWIPPELRESRGEFGLADIHRLPKLVELGDLRGDLHLHTNASDGRASLAEMIRGAKDRGYSYIAVTDHSQRSAKAKGLDAKRLRKQWKDIDNLKSRVKGITLLRGVELDILEDGRLDLPEAVLKEADWVVASIHYGLNQSRNRITRRLLNAIKCPNVHAIAHPTGRLLGEREGNNLDLGIILQAAADYGCMLELNARPNRLDLDDLTLISAKERGVRVVISTDAHSVDELTDMEFGVFVARRAGLEAADVANTRSLAHFRKLLK